MALIRNALAQSLARDAIVMDLADVRVQADLIVQHATKRAEEILREAEAERKRLTSGAAQKGHEEGHAKGLADGRKQGAALGRDEALKEHRQRLDTVQASWNGALAEFGSRREDLLLDARTSMLRLALCVAQKIVKRTIQSDPSVVLDQLASVFEMIVLPSSLTVAINPADRELVTSALPSLIAGCRTARHVEIVDEPSISRGSCRVAARRESSGGSASGAGEGALEIDAAIESQLERIVELLLPREAA